MLDEDASLGFATSASIDGRFRGTCRTKFPAIGGTRSERPGKDGSTLQGEKS